MRSWIRSWREKASTIESCEKLDILRLLSIAVANAQWVKISRDSTIRRARSKDGKVFAYYFADGDYHRHELVVHTASVDAVFRKADKIITGLQRH